MVTELWGAALYGDPCRECGFDWSISTDEAIQSVTNLPADFTRLLGERDGRETVPGLSWSAASYVCHVADNLRIWAERLSGARVSGVLEVPGYDQDLLAQARNYHDIGVGAALWSVQSATDLWLDSVASALAGHVVLIHATRGRMTTAEVVRSSSHDGAHHVWDVRRILGY